MSRWTIAAILAALVLIGGVCFAIWRFFTPAPPPPVEVTVISVRGAARWSRLGVEQDLRAGQRLTANDAVRTLQSGRAILRFDDGTRIMLEPETSVGVGQLDESLSRLRFDYGLLAADVVVNQARRFQLQAVDGQARVETRGAGFEASGDRNYVVVAVSGGSVEVQGADGRPVTVWSGYRTSVQKGQKAATPEVIPDSVFLEVLWPATLLRERRARVEGKTEPGSRVVVEGEPVAVDGRGGFSTDLDLAPGTNRIKVEARAPGGVRKEAVSPPIQVDNQPPKVEVDTEGLWRTQ